jgi:Na+/proline symporter
MPNHILERLFGVGQCPTYTMMLRIYIWALLSFGGNHIIFWDVCMQKKPGRKVFRPGFFVPDYFFLVTPLCGVTFSPALRAISDMAEQSPASPLPVF